MNGACNKLLRGFCAMGLCLVLFGCSDDDNPSKSQPTPVGTAWRLTRQGPGTDIAGLAVHDTLIVAVGDGGAVYTSTDTTGREWIVRRQYGPGAGYLDVAWCLGQFAAVGLNGDVIVSSDGLQWVRQSTGGTATLRGVAASLEHSIAVGSAGNIYISEDNDIWEPYSLSGGLDCYDVAYDTRTEKWLITAAGGAIFSAPNHTSADSIVWVTQTTPMSATMTFKAIACTDSAFFVAGVETSQSSGDRVDIYKSTDGLIWYYQNTIEAWDIEDMLWTGHYLVAVGRDDPNQVLGQDGVVLFSEDGATWDKAETGSPLELKAVTAYNSAEIVAAGTGGCVLAGENPDSLAIVASGAALTGVAWAGDRFVAVSERGTSLFSPTGLTWQENPNRIAYSLFRLATSGSKFVSLGGPGVLTELYTYSDGNSWQQTHAYDGTLFTDVCWGHDRFVAVGYFGATMVSSDGLAWSPHSTGDSTSLQAVCWDGSRFVAGSAGDGVYVSSDGNTWSHLSPSAQIPVINRITYGNGRYVAVGNSYGSGSTLQGYAGTSTDGQSWDVVNLGAYDTFYDVAWTGSHYVICGKNGLLLYSTDGANWTDAALPTTATLYDLAVGDGQAIAVGEDGTVLVSP